MATTLRHICRVKSKFFNTVQLLAKSDTISVARFKNSFSTNSEQLFQKNIFSNNRLKAKVALCVASVSSVFAINYIHTTFAGSEHPVSRSVKGVLDIGNQKLTLYQFQSCPYCCKVRAALDYYGFTYDVVEVNSLTKKQIKFSDYKKVPILVVDKNDEDYLSSVQFNDSSVIVSALGSYINDQSTSLQTLQRYYPGIKEKEGRKTVWDFPNKYFTMYGESAIDTEIEKEQKLERKWRRWTDNILMHTISPNVYRTPSESLEAFHHFSEWGEWEKHFSKLNNVFIVYVGALAMYIIGRVVKKRHNIKENPRESLFDACTLWMKAVGKNKFLGKDKPNLADISVYGALHSFEGCLAFKDLMDSHRIKKWYTRMEQEIEKHQGSSVGKSPVSPLKK